MTGHKSTQDRRDRNYNSFHDDWNELGAPTVREMAGCLKQFVTIIKWLLLAGLVIGLCNAIFGWPKF